MPTRKAITVAVTILLLLSFGPASYAKGWEYLGEAHVDGAADHDKIKVGRSEGRFRALQNGANARIMDRDGRECGCTDAESKWAPI